MGRMFTIGAVICLVSAAAVGQTITGSITGTVSDSSGAVIPNARITATSIGTNLSSSTLSNSAGVYNLLFLPIGDYKLTVEVAGFKKIEQGPFTLEVNQVARIDPKMEIGEVTQSVNVGAVAPILQTDSTQSGGVISGENASSLPLPGRSFTTLTLLMPGSVTPSGTSGRPYTNGNREQSNNFLLDGVDINETIDNGIAFNPSVDAIAEVSIATGNGAAEFGNANGSIVSMALKSGTNQFHGNAYDYLRNDKLDANAFFRNRSGLARSPVRRNIFGGTLGGPVRKDRVFFFVDYDAQRQPSGGTTTVSLAPTAARTGDLSKFPTPIRDPLLTGACTATDRTACFPGNIIPQSRIVNPAALALFANPALYPLPNTTGTGALGLTNNYVTSSASYASRDQADMKLDARLTIKDNISARYTIVNNRSGATRLPLPTSVTVISALYTESAVVNWVRVISPTVVNEARAGWTRPNAGGNTADVAGVLGNTGNAKLGIAGGQPDLGMSTINIGDGMSAVGGGANNSNTTDEDFQYGDNLSFHRGRHQFKMGGQALRYDQNRFYGGNNGVMGFFTYTGLYTGDSFADFLLNDLQSKGRGSLAGRWGQRQWRLGLFFQDDFKVRPNLTLNLGIRWEYDTPIVEVKDRQSNIDLATGALLQAGQGGNSRALYRSYYKQFEPRVGIAWTPDGFKRKMVVRAAFGITSYLEGTGANLRLPLNPPFFYESNINYDANKPGDIRIGFTDVVPLGNTLAGQVRYWNPDLRPAFIPQWNFSLEYQLAPTLSLTTAYVGEKGTHLVNPREYNQPLPGSGPLSTWAPAVQRQPEYGVLPLVTNISGTDSSSIMNYNSLQVSARKRFSHGLEFQASYTFSKVLTDNRGYYGNGGADGESAYWENAYNRRGDYGVGFFNATHLASAGAHYDLPFGKKRTFGAGWNRAVDAVLGGWGTDYVFQAHSGFPVSLLVTGTAGGQDARGANRPNRYMSGFTYAGQSIDHWFGTADTICLTPGVNDGKCAYGAPDATAFGNSAKATEHAPDFVSLDFNISKQFHITESKYVMFRSQFFNLPNHASFSPPARNISAPTTFGAITGVAVAARTIEMALKFYF
jgi:Carboxypeptidase regulatory-like domain